MSKPIKLFLHATGPNPWKVVIILEELGLPYQPEWKDFSELKKPEYEQYNPNGRVPTIIDPNTGITLWESGAIIQYLVETYDKEGKLSYPKAPEKFYANQWLQFQMSGQGPYFGQAAWFHKFHPEAVPSAKDRYKNEIIRVTKVLDSWLKDHPWLVGDHCSYADLSFITWYWMLDFIFDGPSVSNQLATECPAWKKWWDAMNARPAVKKTLADKMAKMNH